LETLDLEYLNAKPLVTRQWQQLQIALVGCGGTGSWLAPHLARIAAVLKEAGKGVALTFIDPDTVEAANFPRQNFCAAETSRNKAETLALRYGTAWGLQIGAVPHRYEGRHTPWPLHQGHLLLIVGCVDNAAARRAIEGVVAQYNKGSGRADSLPATWWLDCGNMQDSGQVLLGAAPTKADMAHAFKNQTICTMLPSPTLQAPDLLEALPEELAEERRRMSCAELAMRDAQGMNINTAVANVAADYVLRLVGTGGLKRFATYIDLPSGVVKSFYNTPEQVAASFGVGDAATFFKSQEREKVGVGA
jgi:PRTRC genetic system ThiF family protein